ncbi:MAG: M1 family metallopeptidase [Candidatus Hydrothermales bacterium]
MKIFLFLVFSWEQKVNYKIDLELDTLTQILMGHQKITYKNFSPDTLRGLYLYLYTNGLKNFDTEATEVLFKNCLFSFSKIFGKFIEDAFIEIDSIKIRNQKVNFKIDETVLWVPLLEKLKPEDSLNLLIFFRTKVPKILKFRAGRNSKHYDFGQFFPVLCVYDKKGWHNRKWDFFSEFYHNFSNFYVKVKLPGNYIVAGVGECLSKNDTLVTQEEKEVIFKADNVVDFFFSCSPLFLFQDTLIDSTHIISFYKKENKAYKDSFLIRTVRAYAFLKELFGEYPYKWLKAVDGLIEGGMEYPGVILCGDDDFSLILHEVAHTYFMGALANNQADEAWLDEGGATFITDFYEFKKEKNLGIFYKNSKQITEIIREGSDDTLLLPAHAFKNYYFTVYSKGSHIYAMLLNIMGEEKFKEFLREYYRDFKFKHPDTDSFFNKAEKIYGETLEYIKNYYVKSLPVPDFGIKEVKKIKAKDKWLSKIKIKNSGNTFYPLDVYVINQKDTVKFKLKPFKKDTLIEVYTDFEPKRYALDPYNFSLDIKRIDNFYPTRFEKKLSLIHNPEDESLYLNYFPFAFYSPKSGLSPGINYIFSYIRRYPYFEGEIYYSSKEKIFYYNIKYSFFFPYIKPENIIYLKSLGFEKNYYFCAGLDKIFRKHLKDPKSAYFNLEFVYKDSKVESRFFDNVNYGGFKLGITLFPKTDLFSNRLGISTEIYPQKVSGDLSFRKIFFIYESTLSPFSDDVNELFPLKLKFNFYYGKIEGNFPKQEYISNFSNSFYDILDLKIERNFILSGNYTFVNEGVFLKGYNLLKFKKLFLFSLEKSFKHIGFFYEKILWGEDNLWNFGLIFRKDFYKNKIRINIYLPLYINNPKFNSERRNFDFRLKINLKFFDIT